MAAKRAPGAIVRKFGQAGNPNNVWTKVTAVLLRSDAHRALSVYAKALLPGIMIRYNGRNNGNIPMSVREAATYLDCSPKTAHRALQDLEQKGFIRPTTKGSFHVKSGAATEWFVTEFPEERNPKRNTLGPRDYQSWVRDKKPLQGRRSPAV